MVFALLLQLVVGVCVVGVCVVVGGVSVAVAVCYTLSSQLAVANVV